MDYTDMTTGDWARYADEFIAESKASITVETTMDYGVFVKRVLPELSGSQPDPDFMRNYAGFIGGLNVRVIVMRDGLPVYKIEPIVSSLEIKPRTENDQPAESVFASYKTLAPVNPNAAISNMSNALLQRSKIESLDDFYLDAVALNNIFKWEGIEQEDLSGLELLVPDTILAKGKAIQSSGNISVLISGGTADAAIDSPSNVVEDTPVYDDDDYGF